ncbi:MAG TPA: hypothetical protein VKE96_23515 [Vicinamibacterales bacterium]|nr:hypothetical protein [Vicinamibacterales bacterium]
MFKSLDVLIGLAVIMLALSMAVTMMTQFVTTVLNSRGRHLRKGLADLLGQLDPAVRDQIANEIATAVLTHPLVSNSFGGLGSVVHRDEFTKLLLLLTDDSSSLRPEAKAALVKALQDNGITDPKATLARIRSMTLDLEAARPHVGADARQAMAILQEAKSDFVAKVNNWFDQTIDRVSMHFTATTRAITFGAALLVAVALQVDTIDLVNRLGADDTMRNAFVQQAASLGNTGQETAPDQKVERQYMAFLAEKGLISIPDPGHWLDHWRGVNALGVLITSLLLSLGAPFWYNALSSLIQLRSGIAAKDDVQRQARHSPETAPAPRAAASPPAAATSAAAAPSA